MSDTEAPVRSRTEPEPSGRAPAYYPDDEISLIDLWNVLVRRRWLIAGVTLLCLLVAGLYTTLVTPVYESRSVLLVGKVASIGPVEDPNEMTLRLREAYRVDDDTVGDR